MGIICSIERVHLYTQFEIIVALDTYSCRGAGPARSWDAGYHCG